MHDVPQMLGNLRNQNFAISGGYVFDGGRKIYIRSLGKPDEAAPYIVWSLLAATPENNLTRRPPADRESISVDVFARDEQELVTLTAAARNALEPHGHVMTMQSLGMEASTGLWRMNFDIDWFYHR